jgi:Lon protease-like protein
VNTASVSSIPGELGAMVLPGATLFPGSLLPLYIFEPRYRAMLSEALQADRVFAVANLDDTTGHPSMVGGAGLIRACVQNEDGTSHLVLQGIGRVRFARWKQEKPYFIGSVEQLSTVPVENKRAGPLMKEIRSLCSQLAEESANFPEKFITHLDAINDPGVLSDVLAATLIADSETRQSLLEELDAAARLETVREFLQSMTAIKKPG